MLVVTGLRSGTSWVMQILIELGYPIKGYKFHPEFSHKELNPNGYWDLPMAETMFGLKTHYAGYAVKLGGGALYQTNPDFVKKVIVCKRNKDDTILSIQRLLEMDGDMVGVKPTLENAKILYELNNHFTKLFFLKNNKPELEVTFENIKKAIIKEFVWQSE